MQRLVSWVGRAGLALAGWRVVGERPAVPRYVLIAAPHTSNWDFPLMMLCGMALGVWPVWVGKEALFRPPLGWLMRALRGIPVERSSAHDMVRALADLVAGRTHVALAMPPEGTRGRTEHWRSGFYFVARESGVPIALGYLDYGRREGGIGTPITASGDPRADMDLVRAFYADKRGRFPELQGPIRLKAEDARPGQAATN